MSDRAEHANCIAELLARGEAEQGLAGGPWAPLRSDVWKRAARCARRRALAAVGNAVLGFVRRQLFDRVWLLPLIVSVSLSMLLIRRKFGLMGATFLVSQNLDAAHLPVLLAATAAVDLSILATLAVMWAGLCRLCRVSFRLYAAIYAVASLGLVLGLNLATYQVLTFLKDYPQIRAAINMAGGLRGVVPYLTEQIAAYAVPTLLLLLVAVLCVAVIRVLGGQAMEGRKIPLAAGLRLAVILWPTVAAVEYWAGRYAQHPIAVNLRRTCLHQPVAAILGWATDFDADGRGWIDHPYDFAPFDARRKPFAPDVPGNGIDENGIGGDLPGVTPLEGSEPALPRPVSTPDVVLIVACSFRADAVFGGALGPGDAPRLARMAAEGFGTDQAYSHAGFTVDSLKTLLSGRLVKPNRSLITEFRSYGYRVGAFSVQDDGFGDVRAECALAEADCYFDASRDPAARVTLSTVASSMMLPFARLLPEIDAFLESGDPARPVFLFTFLATTHYAYSHDSGEMLVPCTRLQPSEIRPARRAEVVAMYRNAVANLDRQIGTIVDHVAARRTAAPPVFIVLGDHGESLYDDGMLGHGIALNDYQSRVPLVILNGWGQVPVPFGLCDLRPFLLGMLGSQRPERPRVTSRAAERPVFQWVGAWRSPLRVGFRYADARVSVDLISREFIGRDDTSVPLADACTNPESLSLIHHWESLRIAP